MTAIAIEQGQRYLPPISNSGNSQAAMGLNALMNKEFNRLHQSVILGRPQSALSTLYASSEGGTITGTALNQVGLFLALLPDSLPNPDIWPGDDGDIYMEWYRGRNRSITICFDHTGNFHYAAIPRPGETAYGTEILSDEIPDSILYQIERIVQSPNSAS